MKKGLKKTALEMVGGKVAKFAGRSAYRAIRKGYGSQRNVRVAENLRSPSWGSYHNRWGRRVIGSATRAVNSATYYAATGWAKW